MLKNPTSPSPSPKSIARACFPSEHAEQLMNNLGNSEPESKRGAPQGAGQYGDYAQGKNVKGEVAENDLSEAETSIQLRKGADVEEPFSANSKVDYGPLWTDSGLVSTSASEDVTAKQLSQGGAGRSLQEAEILNFMTEEENRGSSCLRPVNDPFDDQSRTSWSLSSSVVSGLQPQQPQQRRSSIGEMVAQRTRAEYAAATNSTVKSKDSNLPVDDTASILGVTDIGTINEALALTTPASRSSPPTEIEVGGELPRQDDFDNSISSLQPRDGSTTPSSRRIAGNVSPLNVPDTSSPEIVDGASLKMCGNLSSGVLMRPFDMSETDMFARSTPPLLPGDSSERGSSIDPRATRGAVEKTKQPEIPASEFNALDGARISPTPRAVAVSRTDADVHEAAEGTSPSATLHDAEDRTADEPATAEEEITKKVAAYPERTPLSAVLDKHELMSSACQEDGKTDTLTSTSVSSDSREIDNSHHAVEVNEGSIPSIQGLASNSQDESEDCKHAMDSASLLNRAALPSLSEEAESSNAREAAREAQENTTPVRSNAGKHPDTSAYDTGDESDSCQSDGVGASSEENFDSHLKAKKEISPLSLTNSSAASDGVFDDSASEPVAVRLEQTESELEHQKHLCQELREQVDSLSEELNSTKARVSQLSDSERHNKTTILEMQKKLKNNSSYSMHLYKHLEKTSWNLKETQQKLSNLEAFVLESLNPGDEKPRSSGMKPPMAPRRVSKSRISMPPPSIGGGGDLDDSSVKKEREAQEEAASLRNELASLKATVAALEKDRKYYREKTEKFAGDSAMLFGVGIVVFVLWVWSFVPSAPDWVLQGGVGLVFLVITTWSYFAKFLAED